MKKSFSNSKVIKIEDGEKLQKAMFALRVFLDNSNAFEHINYLELMGVLESTKQDIYHDMLMLEMQGDEDEDEL